MAAIKGKVALLDNDGKILWETKNGFVAHDMQVLDNGNVLFQRGGATVVEVNKDGKTVWEHGVETRQAIQGSRRSPCVSTPRQGVTMIAETGNKRIIEIDKDGKDVFTMPLMVDKRRLAPRHAPGPQVGERPLSRLPWPRQRGPQVRPNRQGGVELQSRSRRPGTTAATKVTARKSTALLRLPNGNTLLGAGNNNRVLEVDKDGKIVWEIKHDELPGIKLFWVTSLQVLPNGNVIICNTHAGKDNPQLIEVNRDKKVVWTFNKFDMTGNDLCTIQLMDVKGKVIR